MENNSMVNKFGRTSLLKIDCRSRTRNTEQLEGDSSNLHEVLMAWTRVLVVEKWKEELSELVGGLGVGYERQKISVNYSIFGLRN